MALLNLDSFDVYGSSYTTVRGPNRWHSLGGNVIDGARAGGKALGGLAYGNIYFDPTIAEWGFGFRFYWDGRACTGIAFGYVGGYAEPHRDWQMSVDVLGRIYMQEITLQSPGPTWQAASTLFTCSKALVANSWNFIECKQVGSTATVRVAENTVGSGSLASEAQGGFGFYLETNSGLGIDDWHLFSIDAETADFIGDQGIEAYAMMSDDTAEWDPKTGTDNFAMIDELPSDEETTYNSTDSPNKTDLFQIDPTAITDLTLEVFGVQLTVRAEHATTSSLDLAPLIVSGTTESLGTQWGLPVGYGNFIHPLASDPDTSAAWTVAGILAAKYGYRSKTPAG